MSAENLADFSMSRRAVAAAAAAEVDVVLAILFKRMVSVSMEILASSVILQTQMAELTPLPTSALAVAATELLVPPAASATHSREVSAITVLPANSPTTPASLMPAEELLSPTSEEEAKVVTWAAATRAVACALPSREASATEAPSADSLTVTPR